MATYSAVPKDAPVRYPPSSVMSFDGSNDYIDCGNGKSLNLTKALTLETWVKFPSGEYGYPISKGISNGDRYYALAVDGDNNDIDFYYSTSQEKSIRVTSDTVTLDNNQWQHLAITVENTELVLYINGVAKTNRSLKSDIPDNLGASLLFGRRFPHDYYLKGQMSEVRIWNVVRTAEDIKAHMSQRLWGDEPGLVGYWPLDEGSGTVANDKTKHGNQGTIHGAKWVTSQQFQIQTV